jgi:adenylate cyclase
MSSDTVDRKIAVILATDVVGYSKHMETNEKETVKNLKVCEKILRKTFENHKGRLFNTGGDSFLIEFPSAVEAVECAVSFQEQIKKEILRIIPRYHWNLE